VKLHSQQKSAARIVVVGSLNIDYVAAVERLPRGGETVLGKDLQIRFGGKGANQAVAASRQGAQVSLIGCVGGDAMGRAYRRRLREEGIVTTGLRVVSGASTGAALIAVDRRGENQIVAVPGANGLLMAKDIRAHEDRIRRADLLVTQLESPLATVVTAIRTAGRHRVPVLLNPSPWRPDFPWGALAVDFLVVNEIEAEALFRFRFSSLDRSTKNLFRRRLKALHVGHLVITRAARPAWFVNQQIAFAVPTLRVKPVDTVGAGDAFTGALAAQFAAAGEWKRALLVANAAGALATLAPGAQEGMPTRQAAENAAGRITQAAHVTEKQTSRRSFAERRKIAA